MTPRKVFNNGLERANYCLDLYDVVKNSRKRGTRKDWARKFKRFMRWPQGERIERIDGSRAVLILRQGAKLEPKHFDTESLEELLRAALVGIVASLDRYGHDVVVSQVLVQLRRSEKKASGELRRLSIPIFAVKAAVLHARIRRGKGGKRRTRPMVHVRHAVQDLLHLETFQRADDIARALSMVGIQNIWQKCERQMRLRAAEIARRLNQIVDRRNRIVHEGDVVRRRKGGSIALHKISRAEVHRDVQWIGTLVSAIDRAVNRYG